MPDRRYGGTVAADGTATIRVRTTGTDGWTVRQVSVEMTAGTAASVPGAATCVMRKNGALVTVLIAQGDAAVEPPAVGLQPGDELTLEWAAGTAGNLVGAFVIYDVGSVKGR